LQAFDTGLMFPSNVGRTGGKAEATVGALSGGSFKDTWNSK